MAVLKLCFTFFQGQIGAEANERHDRFVSLTETNLPIAQAIFEMAETLGGEGEIGYLND